MKRLFTKLVALATLVLVGSTAAQAQSTANYAFTTNTTGSLSQDANGNAVNMTVAGGATQLVADNSDQGTSGVVSIGFPFIFMGNQYTQFSASANNILQLGSTAVSTSTYVASGGAATAPKFSALSSDSRTALAANGGGVFSRVVGSAPNRCLVIQWITNSYWSGNTAVDTFQVRLYETSGIVEYVYGSMPAGEAVYSTGYQTGFSVGTATNQLASVNIATNTVSYSAFNIYSATVNTNFPNIHTPSSGQRRVYRFTPPATAPADPTTLTFSAVGANATTVNWLDNSTDEGSFIITRATDAAFTQGVVVTSVASTTSTGTGQAYSSVQSGLAAGTTYYYKIQTIAEAVPSAGITGNQATTGATTYYWIGQVSPAPWSVPSNWNTAPDGSGSNRVTPEATDILIVDGLGFNPGGNVTITVDVPSHTIGQFHVTDGTNLTLVSDNTTTRTITLSGAPGDEFLIANGSTLNLNAAANTPVAFAFTGSNHTGTIDGTLNLGGNTNNKLTTTGSTGTVVTVSSNGVINFTQTAATNQIASSTASLVFANGSVLNLNVNTFQPQFPLATWNTSSNLNITGVTSGTTAPANSTQTFGNIIWNNPGQTGIFPLFNTSGTINGNLTVTNAGSGTLRLTTSGFVTINGNVVVTAGTNTTNGALQGATTGDAVINGNLTVNGGSVSPANGAGRLWVNGNTTIGSGTTLYTNPAGGTTNPLFIQAGSIMTNNGTIVGVPTGGTLYFGAAATPTSQTFAGTGSFSGNLGTLSVDDAGLNITHNNQFRAQRVNMFTGNVTGGSKLTIGNGGTNPAQLQFGNGATGTPLAAGSFDVAPVLDLGAGTYNVFYGLEPSARISGFGIPTSRSVSTLTVINTYGVTFASPAFVDALVINAGAGHITTSATNLLTITGTSTTAITGATATSHIKGPLALTLPANMTAAATYVFPIGKSSYNPFVLVNPTTNAGGTVTVQAEVFDGNSGGTAGASIGTLNTDHYWAASITNGAANFTNTRIRLIAAPGSAEVIAAGPTQTGAYSLVGGAVATITSTDITSSVPAATTIGNYYVMATTAAPVLSNLNITPSGTQCTNVARTVTVDIASGGSALTSVTLNYQVNGGAVQTVTMTNTSGNTWEGIIPTVTPSDGTVTWNVSATDAAGLSRSLAGTSYKDEPLNGVMVTVTRTPATICEGESSTLSVALNKGGLATLGAGATTATSYDGIFYHLYGGNQAQFLVKASELTALGVGAGNITSLGINMASGTAFTYNGFAVSIADVGSRTNMSGGLVTTGFTQVYGPVSYAIPAAAGVQTITFATPFNWNGTSDIVIKFCWSNNNTGGTSRYAKVDATSFVSCAYYRADSQTPTAICSGTTATGTTSNRPQFVFGANVLSPAASASWSDGATTVGNTNPVTVNPTTTTTYTATVNISSCPITAQVTVNTLPQPTAPTATNSSQCGAGVPTASVADPNGFTTPTFKWYAAATGGTALQSATSTTYTTAVTNTTTFYVSVVNPATSCESGRTAVTVTVTPADVLTASASQTTIACLGGSTTLDVTQTGSNQNYALTWTASPQAGSGIAAGGTPGSLGSGLTVTPTAAGTYTYTITGVDGSCASISTVTVNVNNPLQGITAFATANPATVCSSAPTTLTASVTQPGTVTLGAGATTATSYDGIFYHLYGGNQAQFLVKASELTALGVGAGNITSLGINMASGTAFTYNGFAVSIADVGSRTNMSGGLVTTGFTQVYGPVSYAIPAAAGVQTITFATPFNWNGTSDIVIKFCWSNNNTGGTSRYAKVDATSFVSCAYYRADSQTPTAICSGTTATGTTSNRPQFVFGANVLSPAASASWSDGATTVGNTNPVTVNPTTTTTYTATVNISSCPITAQVTVNTLPQPTAPTATNSSQCGAGVPTASVADPNGFTTPTFKWYAAATGGTALQSATSTTYTTAVTNTTTFYVSVVNPATSCESGRTAVTVTVTPADVLTASASQTTIACLGGSTTLDVTQTGSNQNYALTWTASPQAGSGIAAGGTPGSLGSGLTVTPTAAGTYTYTITGVDGSCASISTVTVNVNDPIAGRTATASASPTTICAGAPSTLTATIAQPNTAANPIGTSTNLTTTTGELTAFGNRRVSYHTQLLYTAAELTASGLTAGNITAVTFNINSLGDAATNANFTVKAGNTSLTAFTAFVATTGMTTVFPAATYTHAVGANTINFSTPFYWNGTSNIILDFTYDGIDNVYNAQTYYTTTTDNTVAYSYNGATTATLSKDRFNTTLKGTAGAAASSVVWSNGGTTNPLTVTPTTTTTYTATITVAGCTVNSNPVTVTVNPTPTTPAGSNGAHCGNQTPVASVTTTSGTASPVFRWYLSPAAGATPIAGQTGSTLVGYPVNNTTDFYVSEVGANGCEGPRVHIVETVTQPQPLAITPTTQTLCNNGIGSISVTPATISGFNQYVWTPATDLYTDNLATVPYTAGTNASVVYVKSATLGSVSYTLTATNTADGCTNTVTASVNVLPAVSVSVSPASICVSGTPTATLANGSTFLSAGATITWASSTDGINYTAIPGAGGASYTPASPITTSTYYRATVSIGGNTCSSADAQVVVNSPTVVSTTPASRCGYGAVTLGATANPGENLNWYTAAAGGTSVGTGTSFTTPNISSTTTYYVAAASAGATSYTVGKASTTGADGTNTGSAYLIFDATSSFALNTVTVYPSGTGAGTMTIALQDAS